MCAKKDDTVVGSEPGQCGVSEAEGICVANGVAKEISWVRSGTHGGCC